MFSEDGEKESNDLELVGVIGFNGAVNNGLVLHPGDQHIIYPLGSTIVVKHLTSNTQTFLQKNGHNRSVSALALSSTGKYLASGQESYMGFTAPAIIWDLETYEIVHKLILHKGKIQDVAFSPNELYMATLGGRDDNKLVIWDVKTGEPICGSTASSETCLTVRFFNNRDDMIVTGGSYNLRVWTLDLANRKIRPADCHLGQLRRVISHISIDADDEFMYCSTRTGDLLKVSLGPKLFKASGPKAPFQNGISCSLVTRNGNFIVGAGDGTVALILAKNFKVVRKLKFAGGITSLALNAAGDHFFAGTSLCDIYCCHIASFEYELRNTCHSSGITDIAFPANYSELFATCGVNDIRVWHAGLCNELLRIKVPGLTCLCVAFMTDGKSIISGWSDDKIRAFRPRTGKLMYTINDAHKGGVTAITSTRDCRRIISGGKGGKVRIWAIGRQTQQMIASMKEHKGPVNSVQVNDDGTECVSASADGSCIVWSLERFVRNIALFASTQFRSVQYHPDHSQLLTTGTDRKITYWDVVDGNPIRIIDGSDSDLLTSLSISADGNKFVSGGGDRLVQLWGYDEGFSYCTGVGHSGCVTRTVISPDQRLIVSVGEEGAIFMWKMPYIPEIDDQAQENGMQQGYPSPGPAKQNFEAANTAYMPAPNVTQSGAKKASRRNSKQPSRNSQTNSRRSTRSNASSTRPW